MGKWSISIRINYNLEGKCVCKHLNERFVLRWNVNSFFLSWIYSSSILSPPEMPQSKAKTKNLLPILRLWVETFLFKKKSTNPLLLFLQFIMNLHLSYTFFCLYNIIQSYLPFISPCPNMLFKLIIVLMKSK